MLKIMDRRTGIPPSVQYGASVQKHQTKTHNPLRIVFSSGSALSPQDSGRGHSARREKQIPAEDVLKAILLVSGDDTLRSMLRAYLETMSYLVFSCTDVRRASQVFHGGAIIDLVLVDLHLLGKSGLQLAFDLTDQNLDLPVVFITGPNTDNAVVSAIQHRGWAFLNKPVLLPRLFALLQELLGLPIVQHGLRRNSRSRIPEIGRASCRERV